MTPLYWIVAVIAAGLFVYLAVALFKPELFE
jgi:K+-transporting ATPase KdpF subunit